LTFPSLPAVAGHRDALVQVFLNLLKNAAEALDRCDGGSIEITTAYRHGLSVAPREGGVRTSLPIEICVIDDGDGAPEGIADHLFDPFVTSKKSGGGLGLALVAKLVDDHGGVVEYAREGQPPRTVFRILLISPGRQPEFQQGREEEMPGMVAGERPPGPVRAPQAGGEADDGEPGVGIPEGGHRRVPPVGMLRAQFHAERDEARAERAVARGFDIWNRAFGAHRERLERFQQKWEPVLRQESAPDLNKGPFPEPPPVPGGS